jgi:hypothetical protein
MQQRQRQSPEEARKEAGDGQDFGILAAFHEKARTQ